LFTVRGGIREIDDSDVGEDTLLGDPAARPAVLRVEAREDVVIASSVRRLLETD
jgi:hypothetical protein